LEKKLSLVVCVVSFQSANYKKIVEEKTKKKKTNKVGLTDGLCSTRADNILITIHRYSHFLIHYSYHSSFSLFVFEVVVDLHAFAGT